MKSFQKFLENWFVLCMCEASGCFLLYEGRSKKSLPHKEKPDIHHDYDYVYHFFIVDMKEKWLQNIIQLLF